MCRPAGVGVWARASTWPLGTTDSEPTALTLPDGLRLRLIPTSQSGVYMTDRQFWRVTISDSEHKAEMPDGRVWYFQYGGGHEWVPTRMVDPYGNEVEVVRDSLYRISQVIQHVGAETRVVDFEYWDGSTPDTSLYLLKSMSSGGRTWQYVWSRFTEDLTVIPPEGPPWQFATAGSGGWEPRDNGQTWRTLNWQGTITLPSGGWVRYESSGYTYCGYRTYPDGVTEESPCSHPDGVRLRTRTIGGPSTPSASWSFSYSYDAPYWGGIFHPEYRTTILAPDSLTRHVHQALIYPGVAGEPLRELVVANLNGDEIERKTFTWERVRQWAGENAPGSSWYRDAVPTSVETTRDGRTYRREFAYDDNTTIGTLGHFGQPVQIVETGDVTRTTDIAYHAFTGTRWLSDAVAQVTVDGVVTSAAVYDNTTGFATSRTALGVTTTFAPDEWGNVGSQTDANGHTTTFDHTWGVVSAVHTPASTTTFGINERSETIWATQRGFTTGFQYDALGRQTRIQPPAGNDTVTSYAEDASWVTVARGASWTTTSLDGFGRAVATENSVGVKTLTTYNAVGQVIYASAPFSGLQHTGTQFAYDALGRVLTRTNPDGSVGQYTYDAVADGLRTTITDEEGRQTQQVWQASGSPDGARLARVVDAAGHQTSYGYTVLGSLSGVLSPGGVARTWTYNAQNRLLSQTQPESGTVTYGYDPVGNLVWQTDAEAADDQLHLRCQQPPDAGHLARPGVPTTITYDDSNNRTSVSNGYVSTTFVYDAANRLRTRTDVVKTTPAGTGRSFVSTFTPDENGNVVAVRYPSGNQVQYGYDSENRITEVFDLGRGLTFASGITYHPAGGLSGYASGDGAVHTIDYDGRGRPWHLVGSGVANLPNLTYTYDRVGNVTQLDDVRPVPGSSGVTTAYSASFGYDALDRLTSAIGGGWGALGYGYDALGNRITKTHAGSTTTYGYTSQRLASTTTDAQPPVAFGHDASGNQTLDTMGTYGYTPANMLKKATVQGAVTEVRLRRRPAADAEASRVLAMDVLSTRPGPGALRVRAGRRAARVDAGPGLPGLAAARGGAAGQRHRGPRHPEGRCRHGDGDERAGRAHLRRDLQPDVRHRHRGDADGDAGSRLGLRGLVGRRGLRGRRGDGGVGDDLPGHVHAVRAALCEAGAPAPRHLGESVGDAGVDGGAERRLLGVLGHDQQQRLRHGVATHLRRHHPRGRAPRLWHVLLAGEDGGERRRGGRWHVVAVHGVGAGHPGGSLDGGVLPRTRR